MAYFSIGLGNTLFCFYIIYIICFYSKNSASLHYSFTHSYTMKVKKTFMIIALGVLVGGGGLFLYLLRAHTYLTDDPAACVNCHIMGPYYATWFHSSHGRDATCNDCHVPQENFLKKWAFKGKDGTRHIAVFVTRGEKQVLRANDQSAQVIMNNCIRCHTQLNTEFVSAGRVDFMMSKVGEGKACWDCHRNSGHSQSSLSTSPDALVPYPDSPTPQWLRNMINKK